jgi:hypothetical protein
VAETLGSFGPNMRLSSSMALRLRERILLFEEPDALIALVRVFGGLGGQPLGLPGIFAQSLVICVHLWLKRSEARLARVLEARNSL